MLETKVGNERVTAELHPKGKHLRVRCSCQSAPEGIPCTHISEALVQFVEEFDEDLEGEESERGALVELLEGPDGLLAEEIEEFVRDLGRSLADLAVAERSLEEGRREKDPQDRQLAVGVARDQVREARGYVKEDEKVLRDASRRFVRFINGVGKTGRALIGWPTPGLPSERVKELEAEYLAQLGESDPPPLRWTPDLG